MTKKELLGAVAARYLRGHISDEDGDGTARYLLDCLTAEQTAAVARAVLEDPNLSKYFDNHEPNCLLSPFPLLKGIFMKYPG